VNDVRITMLQSRGRAGILPQTYHTRAKFSAMF
jgi:hypothetical protein